MILVFTPRCRNGVRGHILDRMSDGIVDVPTGLTTDGLLGKRYMARFIDSVVLTALIFAVLLALGISATLQTGTAEERHFSWLGFGILIVLWIAYGALLESSAWQATVGKRLMGIRVYDSQGGRLGFGPAVLRSAVKDGPFLAVALLPASQILSLLWLAAHLITIHSSPVYQAIHDHAADTWVAAPEETTQLRLS